ncbi:C39 family peptidase [Candidatus Sumerlaeota bacterium]|nr:C39 family peptidase [Candidatus Sumerlaeota bacterium]
MISFSSDAFAEETVEKKEAVAPIDARGIVPAETFKKSGDSEWLSSVITPAFAFDEMIYSWKLRIPDGEGFRMYLQFTFDDGSKTEWQYGGFWGKVKPFSGKREKPKFAEGSIDLDQVLLSKKATAFQIKVVSEGDTTLTAPPSFHVITTDNKPTKELSEKFAVVRTAQAYSPKVMNLPLRKQKDSKGVDTPDRCQSAALATAMQFFGKPVNLEDVIAWTNDPEYDYPGIWPRTVGTAVQNGFDAYIDRFRTWDDVKATVDQNRIILISQTMPRKPKGYYTDPPYSHLGGHIVALNGWTEDGRIIVTDSALPRNDEGYMVQWLPQDLEKIWMEAKGGVGMVIVPPADAKIDLFTGKLPEFPKGRWIRRDREEIARYPAIEGLKVLVEGKSPEEAQKMKDKFWEAFYKEYNAEYEKALQRGE